LETVGVLSDPHVPSQHTTKRFIPAILPPRTVPLASSELLEF
jgi:hypothetical protein